MSQKLGIGFMVFILSLLFPWPCPAVDLTQAEREYLNKLEWITMCVDPDWEPYERMDEYGNFKGIAADLVELISERLEVPFVVVPTVDWDETLEVSKQGGVCSSPF